jgi:hypothetical protein
MVGKPHRIFAFLLLIFSIAGLNARGQMYSYEVVTGWDPAKNVCFPCDFDVATNKVFSNKTIPLKDKGRRMFSASLAGLEYETIEIPAFYDKNLIASDPSVNMSFEKSRFDNFLVVTYNPVINQGGVVKLLKKIRIQVTSSPDPVMQNRAATFASSSVLASGTWYKIGVSSTGIHKLDESFLNAMGISTSGLNPDHINIYGNHVPKLPTMNNLYHPDDLIKNNIYIAGGSDGSFDAADYILFYATGPDEVITGATDFVVRKNKIDSLAYYFIHIDASDAPARVSSQPNSISPVTHTVTSFNDVRFHENNDVNLKNLKSGDGWFGEHFDIELAHSFSLDLGDVVSGSNITMKTAYASVMKSGTAGLRINVNGVQRDNIPSNTLTGSYTVAKVMSSTVTFTSGTGLLNFDLNFDRSTAATEAWLDYILLNYRRTLNMGANQLLIRDFNSIGSGNTGQFEVSGATSGLQVWEVTDPTNATVLAGNLSGSTYTFIQDTDSLRSYIAFYTAQAAVPVSIGSVANQNLHALDQADYLIVAHESLLAQAERLANLHRNRGLDVHVVEIQKIYNEFGGGAADPVAVRWFTKMFYDRAAGDVNLMPKYLCLFGDGTYDPLNRLPENNYLIPTYNSVESGDVDFISSYTADDFFGLLDDNEGIASSNLLDIGIGRIPVSTLEEAEQVIDKVEHYMNFGSYLYSNANGVQCDSDGYSSTFGDWRTKVVLMADDENSGQFVNDCESLSDTVRKYHPEMNIIKIYLDAYQQTVTSGGQRYPGAEEAINQNMNRGALIFNYVGHGGETGLALERVVTIPMIENWANINNLTVFISATCEFSRFDDPARLSAGEITLRTPYGGAVGLLTTTRLVQITVNTELVQNLYTVMFNEVNGEPLGLGEILRQTKNLSAGSDNVRNFTLLGDPALLLGKPRPMILTDSINGVSVSMVTDTVKALSKITVKGHVVDVNGNLIPDYNGIIYPTLYDKWKTRYTLGQDPESPVKVFQIQNNIIYKGKATVTNGYFSFTFIVPKDIDYAYGKGKISYYANNTNSNSYGFDTSVVVGGVDPNGIVDETGPVIDLYMNDQNFANGGMTNTRPLFLAEISDENGINTTGNGIGHDITLILDGNTAAPIVLNNYYEADLDTYQSGKVSYQFSELEPGEHQLTFKVWDVNNNSSEQTLEFVVVDEEELGISHVLNYPNPFTTNTSFFFEHNQCCSALEVKIEIFTVSGKLVKTIFDNVNSSAYRSEGIAWDGRDDFGDKLARGVYVYRLTVKTPEGVKSEKIEKLVIL